MGRDSLTIHNEKRVLKNEASETVIEQDGAMVVVPCQRTLEKILRIRYNDGEYTQKLDVHNLAEKNPFGKTREQLIVSAIAAYRRSDGPMFLTLTEYQKQIRISNIISCEEKWVHLNDSN